MAPPTGLRPGDVVAGRYVIEALLGESPAARIYLADENPSRQKLCLKLYRPEMSSRLLIHPDFFPKAGVLPALTHDNLAVVYDVQDWEGQVYVAREFLEGPGFEEWARNPDHSAARGLEMLWQAAQALALFHEKAYHLNIHPGNLFLSGFAAKLADPDPRMLYEGDSPATPLPVRREYQNYIAPEMRRGGVLPQPNSDLYGLSGMFFRLITGAHPSENPEENQRRLVGREREISEFIAKAMHADPEQRFPSAESFADAIWALQPLLQRRKVVSSPAAPASKTPTGTLFGDAPSASFAEPKPPPPKTPLPPSPAASPPSPLAPPRKPATKESQRPDKPPPPKPKPAVASLSSLESDSPDLTLSSGGESGLSQFGFGGNPNQTMAIAAQTRRQSRKTLWISLAAAGVALVLLGALFVVLKSSAQKAPEPAVATPESPVAAPAPVANPNPVPAKETPTPVAEQPPFPEETAVPEKLVEERPLRTVALPKPVKPKPKIAPRPSQPVPEAKKPKEAKAPSAPVPAVAAASKPPVEDLVRAVQAHNWPGTTEECLKMADDLNDYGRIAEANKTYSQALEFPGLVPKERVHALGGMAVTFNKMGLKEEAVNALEQLLAIQPGNKFATDLKAQLLR